LEEKERFGPLVLLLLEEVDGVPTLLVPILYEAGCCNLELLTGRAATDVLGEFAVVGLE
jgi:hypothetical protein